MAMYNFCVLVSCLTGPGSTSSDDVNFQRQKPPTAAETPILSQKSLITSFTLSLTLFIPSYPRLVKKEKNKLRKNFEKINNLVSEVLKDDHGPANEEGRRRPDRRHWRKQSQRPVGRGRPHVLPGQFASHSLAAKREGHARHGRARALDVD